MKLNTSRTLRMVAIRWRYALDIFTFLIAGFSGNKAATTDLIAYGESVASPEQITDDKYGEPTLPFVFQAQIGGVGWK